MGGPRPGGCRVRVRVRRAVVAGKDAGEAAQQGDLAGLPALALAGTEQVAGLVGVAGEFLEFEDVAVQEPGQGAVDVRAAGCR